MTILIRCVKLFVCFAVCQVRLYEVLRENVDPPSAAESSSLSPAGVSNEDVDGLRLIQRRRVTTRRPGWEVFQLRNVIRRWVNDPSTNRGLLASSRLNSFSAVLKKNTYSKRTCHVQTTQNSHHEDTLEVTSVFNV